MTYPLYLNIFPHIHPRIPCKTSKWFQSWFTSAPVYIRIVNPTDWLWKPHLLQCCKWYLWVVMGFWNAQLMDSSARQVFLDCDMGLLYLIWVFPYDFARACWCCKFVQNRAITAGCHVGIIWHFAFWLLPSMPRILFEIPSLSLYTYVISKVPLASQATW